jgi:hypothetical protein
VALKQEAREEGSTGALLDNRQAVTEPLQLRIRLQEKISGEKLNILKASQENLAYTCLGKQ